MVRAKLVSGPTQRLAALERLRALCDPGSLALLRAEARSPRMGERATRGDGVIGATGRVDGRPVACYAQDPSVLGGALGEVHAETICRVMGTAERGRMPVVGFVESGGARRQEGVAALDACALVLRRNVALSGRVPQISVVCGGPGAGGSCTPALTDFAVVTGRAATGGDPPSRHGDDAGAAAHGAGACELVAAGDLDAAWLARDLLDYLPQHAGERPRRWPSIEPPDGSPDDAVPAQPRRAYDVRHVARTLVDGGRLLETGPRRARNLVTGLARLDGRAVGIVANQPLHDGGALDAEAAKKGARFVRICDLYGLPLLVLVDTPGVRPGDGSQRGGAGGHVAALVAAFAAATVPRVTVILRRAFGGALVAMNSRGLGADLVLAWPQARLGVLDAGETGGDGPTREPGAPQRLAGGLDRDEVSARDAAREGTVDEVVEPSGTRGRLAGAVQMLAPALADRGRPADRNLPL